MGYKKQDWGKLLERGAPRRPLRKDLQAGDRVAIIMVAALSSQW